MHKLLASLAMLASCTPKTSLDPIADAGPDHLITVGDTASLEGGLSSDSDGEIKTFVWELIDIPESSQAILDGEGPATSLQADALGRYVVQLVVIDNDGNESAPDFVEVVATTPGFRTAAVSPCLASSCLAFPGMQAARARAGRLLTRHAPLGACPLPNIRHCYSPLSAARPTCAPSRTTCHPQRPQPWPLSMMLTTLGH